MFAKAFLPVLTLALTVAAAPQVARRATCNDGRTTNDAKVRPCTLETIDSC